MFFHLKVEVWLPMSQESIRPLSMDEFQYARYHQLYRIPNRFYLSEWIKNLSLWFLPFSSWGIGCKITTFWAKRQQIGAKCDEFKYYLNDIIAEKLDFRILIQRKVVSLHRVLWTRIFLLLNLSHELRPRTRFNEQIQMYIEAAHYSADFNHSTFGAVAGLCESMGRGLRFLYAHTDSAPPYQTLMREL